MPHQSHLGLLGEKDAATYLSSKGYKILATNFYVHGGEIDIVALQRGVYVCVEVKARGEHSKGLPHESVGYLKLRKLHNAMRLYFTQNNIANKYYRIDIVSIVYSSGMSVKTIKHYENVTSDDVQ